MILQLARQYRAFSWQSAVLAVIANGTSTAWAFPTSYAPSAVLVVNNGLCDVFFKLGTAAGVVVAPNSSDVHLVPAGSAVVVDETDPLAGIASYVAVWAPSGGSKISFYRGQTYKMLLFDDPSQTPDPSDRVGLIGGHFIPVNVPNPGGE